MREAVARPAAAFGALHAEQPIAHGIELPTAGWMSSSGRRYLPEAISRGFATCHGSNGEYSGPTPSEPCI